MNTPLLGQLTILIAIVCLGAFGLSLLLWALLWDRSRGRRRCPKCNYSMSAIPTMTCPECGRTAPRESSFFRTRRRWTWAAAGLCVFAFAVAAAGTAAILGDRHFQKTPGGWWNTAPAWMLVNRVTSPGDEPRLALSNRLVSKNPNSTLANPGALSQRQWQTLTAGCKALILDPKRPRSDTRWARDMLGQTIPDSSLVAPVLQELLLLSDCTGRRIAIESTGSFSFSRDGLPPSLLDALQQIAGNPECPSDSPLAANVLAGAHPFPEPYVMRLIERIKDNPARYPVWNGIGVGMSAWVGHPIQTTPGSRSEFLAKLESSPDPAIRKGALSIRKVVDDLGFRPDAN